MGTLEMASVRKHEARVEDSRKRIHYEFKHENEKSNKSKVGIIYTNKINLKLFKY